MKDAEVILLAGGRGTRLRSVVADLPKPLAQVAGRPFLGYLLDFYAEAGFRRAVLSTGYMAEAISAFAGTQWKGMELVHAIEPKALGTGGAVKYAMRHLLGECVFVANGDTWLAYRPEGLRDCTLAQGGWLGIALASVPDVARYGAVRLDGEMVASFEEKGRTGPGLINGGIYYVTGTALEQLPAEDSFSFEAELLRPLTEDGRVFGFKETKEFIDIGVPEDYFKAQAQFE